MDEANRLDNALNDLGRKQRAERECLANAGLANAGQVNGCGLSMPSCEPPSARQLLFEAAQRHQEQAEGLRTLARLLPDDEALSWEVRRSMRVAVEAMVSRR